MRRRSTAPTSSLDLFLDAISNMFGGIVLLAILLSLIVQNHSPQAEEISKQADVMTVEEAQELYNKLDHLQSQHQQLRATIDLLEQNQPKPELIEVRTLESEAKKLQDQVDDAVARQVSLAKQLAQRNQETATLRAEINSLQSELENARSNLEAESSALDKSLDEQLEVLKLPKTETTVKPNVILLVRYGKVYAAFLPNSSTPNSSHVSCESDSGNHTIVPKASKGWNLSELTDLQRLNTYLDRHSPYLHILSIAVWPDSFHEFSNLKQIALQKGYQYQLWPLSDIPALVTSPSDQLQRVQ